MSDASPLVDAAMRGPLATRIGDHRIGTAIATPRARAAIVIVGTALAIGVCGVPVLHVPATQPAAAHDVLGQARRPLTMSGIAGDQSRDTGARPGTVSKVVSCERLPHVPGTSITTVLVDFPAAAYSPAHRHPGSVTAYVLKGAIRSQLDGGAIGTFVEGETFFEPPGTLHNFAENASDTAPAQLLAIFVADSDCGPLTIAQR